MSKRILRVLGLSLVACFLLLGPGPGLLARLHAATGAASFYVSPAGSPSGDGSLASPWDLQTALRHPSAVRPGDTIWLRGGTYRGSFVSTLTGTAAAPIRVRQYPGERATVDGATDPPTYLAPVLAVNGAYTWYMNFEVTNSNPTRTSPSIDSNPPDARGPGVNVNGPGTKIINMVVHDTGSSGIGLWIPAADSEIHGSLVYYTGWDAPDRGHGHGIYTQNAAPSTKRISDNILFDQFGIGIQAYTEKGNIDNIALEGNIAFNNGSLSSVSGLTYNLLLGGYRVANNPSLISNFTYTPAAFGGANNLGYSAGCQNATIADNYFAGSPSLAMVKCSGVSMSGNTFTGGVTGFAARQFPGNSYLAESEGRVFVRKNQYESGRANVAVYNWAQASSMPVDLSGVVAMGAPYEVRDAQNFFGTPVTAGIYGGGTVDVPMSGSAPAPPVGVAAPPSSGPEFHAFVVLSQGGSSVPPPTPPPAPTPTPNSTTTVTTVSPTTTSPGSTLTAAWSGIPSATPRDWLGLFTPGSPNTSFIDWIYVSCSQSPGPARASGSCAWAVAPDRAPGTYEVRLFTNDGYTRLASSQPFSVTEGSPALAASPSTIVRGDAMAATWSGITSPTSTDWLGLYTPGAPDTSYLQWIYVSCTQSPNATRAWGSCAFRIPAGQLPGTYELRLLANDGYTRLARSQPFSVRRGSP